ncbi:Sua5/YciO/YrdC/YwlC family protein [Mesoplasma corruscae]|uniref:L-threonylcarbamoyladenylate synthase n=1 Tax=Mesoplasma corruscae TaxID=216874 RepID=A0A2S5RHD2_9MOLU|nr:Sua5/YciO/YrdC/YwlC family protein [Mesoplasma corruscae]PPE06710.1 tRNA threonylcarbamoyladenosine biosynthesis protein [Mesoplasma corruscae]
MLNNLQISDAVNRLLNQELVIIPTDTIFGISAIYSSSNINKINKIKKSKKYKPLIILISCTSQLEKLGIHEKLLLQEKITYIVETKNKTTLAIRMIKRKDIKKIVDSVGPIISTSVNFHGKEAINTEKELIGFNKNIQVFFDKEPDDIHPSKIYNTITKLWVR